MDSTTKDFLFQQGFTFGMIRMVEEKKTTYPNSFPVHIWILDNSFFMNVLDSHSSKSNHHPNGMASRWEELQDCVAYHAQISRTIGIPIRFALINPPLLPPSQQQQQALPQYFSLNQSSPPNLQQEYHILQAVMTMTQPHGPALLTRQLGILRNYIVSIAPQLKEQDQTIPIVLATQGLPTDENNQSSSSTLRDFIQALKSFQNLPVWFIVRLCTDDERAFEFYNSLDVHLTLPCDVLDDYYGEAVEVYLRNPWLTYGMSLHRFREMGFRIPILDVLDERSLTPLEIRDFCIFLFALSPHTVPDPMYDWQGFMTILSNAMSRESIPWNPITKTASPWLDLRHLDALYHPMSRPNVPSTTVQSLSNSTTPSFTTFQQPQQQQHQQQKQQQQQQMTSPPTSSSMTPLQSLLQSNPGLVVPIRDPLVLTKFVTTRWARMPPTYHRQKTIAEMLMTIDLTFLLVDAHPYFQEKYQPFSKHALESKDDAVFKRGRTFILHYILD
jgi:hypothetical protein